MASFEEEGSAFIRDLSGCLAAPNQGIRDNGLIGVDRDVLHRDLLLAFCRGEIERLGQRRERSRRLIGECQVSGTHL
jgi:hypothetical protein